MHCERFVENVYLISDEHNLEQKNQPIVSFVFTDGIICEKENVIFFIRFKEHGRIVTEQHHSDQHMSRQITFDRLVKILAFMSSTSKTLHSIARFL